MDFFTEQYFQKLITEIGQPESKYPSWLGQALALMVTEIDRFPTTISDFDPHIFRDIIEWMRRPTSGQPGWLADVLAGLVEEVGHFPPPGNEDTYIVEYIYPH